MGPIKRSSTSTSSNSNKFIKIYDDGDIETDQDDCSKENNETPVDAMDVQISRVQADTNLPLRNGKIVRIRLVNFMCHSNLLVTFHNRINIIAGDNGSGKSAILTGLMVGFGAKAFATHRCANLCKLIKTGEDVATVEIEITNSGPDAFEPKKYGTSIIVERQFSKNFSSYKMKSQNGQIVSKNRDDLNKILVAFNIQIDNPIFMLHQDAARSWLRDLDPQKNYKLFLKATLVDKILEKLTACCLMHKKNQYFFKCHLEEEHKMELELQEFEEKLKLLREAEEIKSEIASETLKKSWIKVIEQEGTVSEIKEALTHLTSEFKELQNQIAYKILLESDIKLEIELLENELKKQKSAIQHTNEVLSTLQVKYKEAKDLYENEVRLSENLHSKITAAEIEIAELVRSVEGKHKSSENNFIELTVDALRADNKDLEAKITDNKLQLAAITEKISALEEQLKNIAYDQKACLVKIDDRQKEAQTLQSSTSEALAVYGRNIKAVREKLEMLYKAGDLSELPRGPFGTYIQILDPRWLPIIELILGRFLHTFVVDNDKDRIILNGIFTGFKINAPIITTKFQKTVYDVSSGRVNDIPGCVLFMNQIKCDDAVVMNCLIDKCHIETIMLTEDQQLAIQLTAFEKDVPKNLRRVIVMVPQLEYLPAPLYRVYSLDVRPPKFLQVNTKEKHEQVLNEIKALEDKTADLESRINKSNETLADLHLQKTKTLQIIENYAANEALNLTTIATQEKISASNLCNGIEYLATELKQKKSDLETKKINLSSIKNSCKVLYNVMLEEEAALIAQTDKTKQVEETAQTLLIQRDSNCLDVRSFNTQIKHWEAKKEASQQELKRINKEYEIQVKILQDLTEKAIGKGDRMQAPNESEEDVQKNIARLTRKLKKFDPNENLEALEERIKILRKRHEEKQHLLKSLRKTLILLTQVRERRFRTVEAFKFHMGLMVKQKFDYIIRLHNFVGTVDFDHLKYGIKIAVVPRDRRIANAVSDSKCLSGGERSYSTVAFLLALWSCVEHPFFFLDEYDVFTDEINRQMITRLLLKEAKATPKCQYVFITPQDVSFVRRSKAISIITLKQIDE